MLLMLQETRFTQEFVGTDSKEFYRRRTSTCRICQRQRLDKRPQRTHAKRSVTRQRPSETGTNRRRPRSNLAVPIRQLFARAALVWQRLDFTSDQLNMNAEMTSLASLNYIIYIFCQVQNATIFMLCSEPCHFLQILILYVIIMSK